MLIFGCVFNLPKSLDTVFKVFLDFLRLHYRLDLVPLRIFLKAFILKGEAIFILEIVFAWVVSLNSYKLDSIANLMNPLQTGVCHLCTLYPTYEFELHKEDSNPRHFNAPFPKGFVSQEVSNKWTSFLQESAMRKLKTVY